MDEKRSIEKWAREWMFDRLDVENGEDDDVDRDEMLFEMTEFALKVIKKEREECAALCELRAKQLRKIKHMLAEVSNTPSFDRVVDGQCEQLDLTAQAIRARGSKT